MGKKRPKKAVSARSIAKNKSDTLLDEAIASAISSASTVLMKVCRLCEGKDGPFLNIFDAVQVTAKKIEDLMPFVVSENDELPHKICFRCSAKVEELYEFIQKCVKTQQNLHNSMGKKGPLFIKTRHITQWEEKLNKSTLSNDTICDALIKKAMEGIEDMPTKPKLLEDQVKQSAKKGKNEPVSVDNKNDECKMEDGIGAEVTLQNLRLSLERIDEKVPTGSNGTGKSQDIDCTSNSSKLKSQKELRSLANESKKIIEKESSDEANDKSDAQSANVKKQQEPFNIMDHVSKIKVNGVGILFQCKLCNKNFLKLEVVESHGCAKNGAPKIDFTKHVQPPQPPKAPSVKFIKIDHNSKKHKEPPLDCVQKPTESNKTDKVELKLPQATENPPTKPKPKIGPASKVKRQISHETTDSSTNLSTSQVPQMKQPTPNVEVNQSPAFPVVSFPTLPKLNSRYSFVLGPNNTFTLVEEPSVVPTAGSVTTPSIGLTANNVVKAGSVTANAPVKKNYTPGPKSKKAQKPPSPEIIDLDDNDETPTGQPYPVGLFKTTNAGAIPNVQQTLPTFSTPAMKKQLYTVVQTGNPSKLLISSKAVQSVEEPPKKRQKKSKEVKECIKEPYKVTLEDATPAKDPGMFTFINVDPLLQPSYVLPTDSIQESQISTTQGANASEKKEKDNSSKMYSCNMCNERFSREKKLLSHIQSHYTKMDAEDQLREKNKKRKSK